MAEKAEHPPGTISQEALGRWGAFPRDTPLAVKLTPQVLDFLFLSIRETAIATADLRTAMLAYSKGDTDGAQRAFDASGAHQANAMRNIDNLIVHAMLTAEPENNG